MTATDKIFAKYDRAEDIADAISVEITGCSMGCLYADRQPIDKCLCKCKGEMHGMMSGKLVHPIKCTPSAAVRCKSGQEGTECKCACKGANHGMYAGIPDYKITTFTP